MWQSFDPQAPAALVDRLPGPVPGIIGSKFSGKTRKKLRRQSKANSSPLRRQIQRCRRDVPEFLELARIEFHSDLGK